MLSDRITIVMDLTSDSFLDGGQSVIAAKTLRKIADNIENHPDFLPGHSQPIIDGNTNEIGWIDII